MTPDERDMLAQQVHGTAWMKRLAENPDFKQFREYIDEDISIMKDGMMITGEPPAPMMRILKLCGMDPPKDEAETVRLFFVFRAVVSYLSMKLKGFDRSVAQRDHGVDLLKEEEPSQVALRST